MHGSYRPVTTTAPVKVPAKITAFFWIIKILSTGMGEATSDFLAHRFNPFVAGAVGGLAFVVAMAAQFRARAYSAWTYWFAVSMVAVFGTMAADGLHIELGIPYAASTLFYLAVLATVFTLWYRTEGTLSIHSIVTPRREAFYWAAVLATFALGTAAGDLTATTLHLGYLASGLVFTGLILVPAVAYWRLRRHEILAFWVAYVLTRPLGASYADWAGVPHGLGGLDIGRALVALSLAIPIVLLVGYVAIARPDTGPAAGTEPGSGGDGGFALAD
jgi:uncharacterized membrane-anchored protein